MFFNNKWHRTDVHSGLSFFSSYLKHEVDRLKDGDSIYCDIDLPLGFYPITAELHIGKNRSGYFMALRPHTDYNGHDINYKRLASGVRFTNWGDMVRFYHNLRLPY